MKITNFLRSALLIALAIIMVLGCVACAKEEELPAETKVDASDADGLNLPDVDYGGKDFIMLVRNYNEYVNDVYIEEVTTESSTLNRKVYERNKLVASEYGVNFVTVTDDAVKINNAVSISALSEPDAYDLIINDGRSIFGGITSGYYYDWNNLEYVSLDKPWWNQSANENWRTRGGKLFAMTGDISPLSIGSMAGMFFNKTILSDANIDSPYQYVYDDNWTLETFSKLVKDADAAMNGDGSGDIASDQFAYATQRWRGPSFAYYCSNEPMIKLSGDKYIVNAGNERTVTAVNDYFNILFGGACYYGATDADLQPLRDAFTAGRVAFNDDNLKCAVEFKGTSIDFGIVPWPKYDEDTEAYPSVIGTGANTFAVLQNTSAKNAERISVILEAMAYYGSKDVISYYYDQLLSYQAMKDADSLAMLQIIHDTSHVDMIQYTNYGNIVDLPRLVLENPSKYGMTIATAVKVVENEVLSMLEAWYALDSE